MERKKASDFDQQVLDLYDGRAHDFVSHRDFLS